MTRYLLRRLPSAAVVLVLASMAVFGIIRLVPGDPAATLAGPDATPESLAQIRADLGLDQPVWTQYVDWVQSVLTLDLGRSYRVGGEVSDLLADAAGQHVGADRLRAAAGHRDGADPQPRHRHRQQAVARRASWPASTRWRSPCRPS